MLIKEESEKHAEQNGGMFQTTTEKLWAFFGINILMEIKKHLRMREYWSIEEGLGNSLIQEAMARDRFLEILQNIHFSNNLHQR